MQRTFVKNLALILFLNLLVKPIWILGVDVSVQNEVGLEVFGDYFILFNFAMLFNVLLDPGISNYTNRSIARDPNHIKNHFFGSAMLKLGFGLIYLLVITVLGFFVKGFEGERLTILILIGINLILQSGIVFLRANVAGLQLFKTDSFLSVSDRLLMIFMCVWLLWLRPGDDPFKIIWYVWVQGIAYVIVLAIGLLVLVRQGAFELKTFKGSQLSIILGRSMPFALLTVLMVAYYRIDAVMLETLLSDGNSEAGIYAQAYKLPEAGIMFAYLFSTLLFPMFSRMLNNKEDIGSLSDTASRLLLLPVIPTIIFVWFFSDEIMSFMYLNRPEDSAAGLQWLIMTFGLVAVSYITGTLLTAKGSMRTLNWIAAAGLLVNVVLNLWLIPVYKSEGSAIATLFTQALVVALQVFYIRKELGFILSGSTLLKLMAFSVALTATLWISQEMELDTSVRFIAFGLVILLLPLLLQVIRKEEVTRLISNR